MRSRKQFDEQRKGLSFQAYDVEGVVEPGQTWMNRQTSFPMQVVELVKRAHRVYVHMEAHGSGTGGSRRASHIRLDRLKSDTRYFLMKPAPKSLK